MEGDEARRSALDHVLRLICESHLGDVLVLRGSATMAAWVGDLARPPRDLDFVVRPAPLVPVVRHWPYPYFARIRPVQHWPEIVHGGRRNEIWEFEEFDTCGQRAFVPPDGLHWLTDRDLEGVLDPVHHEVRAVIEKHPRTPEGVRLHVARIGYRRIGESESDYDFYTGGGTRVTVPYGEDDGVVQVDLAYDEPLPEAPVLTLLPGRDGREPIAAWTAGRDLSLRWKLHWLADDQSRRGASAAKDLYDAVLLAEAGAVGTVPNPELLSGWRIDGDPTSHGPTHGDRTHGDRTRDEPTGAGLDGGGLDGGAEAWLARLAAAVTREPPESRAAR
ncbi:hypothetical protein [Actinoplanes sp. NPDC051851]|uniref:hypothetical protein n=1 Tax=Actinoplanes sp. NPDC051851 TaxID=3154753 RepID=UPI0034260E8D